MAAPVLLAIVVMRHWVSFLAVLGMLVGYGAWGGNHLSGTDSSTAAFAWFGPLWYGIPIVLVVWLAEVVVVVGWRRLRR